MFFLFVVQTGQSTGTLGLCQPGRVQKFGPFHSCLDSNEAEMAEKPADDGDGDGDESSSDADDDQDEGVITEVRFVPSDKAACE